MISERILIICFSISIFFACSPSSSVVELNVTNNLDKDRKSETIEVDLKQLPKLLSKFSPEQIVIKDGNNDQILLSQLIDLNGDKIPDQLIFQSDFQANEHKHFHIEGIEGKLELPKSKISTYARFVPERIDDFAWENDKVAFRTYGPEAQAITESGKPGGTLSSGIDCWLKRVDYPIIDKWYKQDLEEGKSYHKDHGEGLDNYHVGPSRGTGGIGIWKDGTLSTSKNYESWKIIANGPIRTIFELNYGSWDADGLNVKEIKQISIDLGTNLFKNTLLLGNYSELPNITLGITLHDKAGEVLTDVEQGWFRYLEPHDGSELSTAIVVDPSIIKEFIDHRVDEQDLSNLLIVCEQAPEVTYYAGFAWKKSNQFKLPGGFDTYLSDFADRIASPVVVEVVE
ncbi:MAG: DUF4861 domain-containing protein [Cyclobacteriaceae bacterium]|nr:DUF4861 domain-containing protein [Cyclobacteriaceae bacterium]